MSNTTIWKEPCRWGKITPANWCSVNAPFSCLLNPSALSRNCPGLHYPNKGCLRALAVSTQTPDHTGNWSMQLFFVVCVYVCKEKVFNWDKAWPLAVGQLPGVASVCGRVGVPYPKLVRVSLTKRKQEALDCVLVKESIKAVQKATERNNLKWGHLKWLEVRSLFL